MSSFGTKSVLWIEDLTTFKESVLFAHTLLSHWCRGVLEGVAGVAMATPVGTQNIKKERKRKKEREIERERKRKGNVFFIFSIQIYID